MRFRKLDIMACVWLTLDFYRIRVACPVSPRRHLLPALGALALCCSVYAGQSNIASSNSLGNGVVRLPVIDKQDIRFIPFSASGESPQSRIWSIARDNYGFLWLGTSAGLYRYDGYILKRYRHERGDPNSLSDDPIRIVYKDRTGVLWIGTAYGGLDRFDPTQDTFTHYRHKPDDSRSLSDDRINCVYQDRSGALWVGTHGGLDRLDPATGTFAHFRNNPQDPTSLSNDNALSIIEDRQGSLWVGTTRGLNKLEQATGRFSRFLHDSRNPHSLGHDYVNFILEDHLGVLWLASPLGSGLNALDVKTGRFTRYSFHAEEPGSQSVVGVNSLYEDADGILWLCTVDRGLLKLNRERQQFIRYSRRPANPSNLPHDTVHTVLEDAEGVMWVGTQSGLTRFLRKPPVFVNYTHEPGNDNSLRNSMVWSVQEDSKGFLWVGTEDGLNRVDRRTGQVTLYQHDPKNNHSLSYDKVAAIREDQSGTLWFGTYGGGLDRFDPSTGQFFAYRHDPSNPSSLGSDSVLCLLTDRRGALWVGTQGGGLNRFDYGTGRFTAYRHDPTDIDNLLTVIFEDRAGILWLGGQNEGLSRFDPKTEQFTVYRHNGEDLRSLSHNKVNAILEDREGRLWIGTESGLNQLDRSRGTFTSFTTRDGLPDNAIKAILEDAQGYLWLATYNGLSRFHPPTKTFRNFSELDGLPSNFLNPYGAEDSFRSETGEMVFGSSNGVTTFYPDRVSANPYIPPVVLTDFALFNTSVRQGNNSPLQKSIWATDSLTLTHSQSIFTLEFAALSYVAPEKNRYRYRLEELETNWNEVDSGKRRATYTSLPSGHYVFRVQGSNNDQIWNEAGVTLAITILPPWWATWWFRSITGLAVVGLIFAAHRSRVRWLQLEAARLEAQVAERTRELSIAKDAAEGANRAKSIFLANMSHELRTPLSAILGFSNLLQSAPGIAEKERRDLGIINRSGEHLLNLINNVLDVAKIDAGHTVLEIAPCDLRRLLRDITDMMRARAEEKGLKLVLEQSSAFPQFVKADGVKVRQVLINLLGNAVKYTETGTVTLRLNARDADDGEGLLVILEVEDTGIGIAVEDQSRIFEAFVQAGKPARQRGTGLGLAIARQFVELMGGTIHVESRPGKGSLFSVELPLERAQEPEAITAVPDEEQIIALEPGQPEYRILVVEDQKENQTLLERLLQNAGFQVRMAEDGAEAVEMFRTWRPHFIWMDLRLPVMGGVEAARRIRALDGGREVKIVAVTASVFASERQSVLAAGIDDFVRKPYKPAEIFDCLARHLGVRYSLGKVAPAEDSNTVLWPERMASLPEELRLELRDAVVTLNRERITSVIECVWRRDAALGAALGRCTERFAYTAILHAIEGQDKIREQSA